MVRSNRPKVGVGSHCHGHFPEQLKTFLPTNVGTADAMGRRFVRKKRRFGVNSRAGRSQLLRWTLDQKKRRPVTGKRMRRRQDMRSAPVGPAGGMRNVHTEQAVSSRGQPVQYVWCVWSSLVTSPVNQNIDFVCCCAHHGLGLLWRISAADLHATPGLGFHGRSTGSGAAAI